MKKIITLLVTTVLVALVVTTPSGAASDGKFVGTPPTCTADTNGNVECTARVAGLTEPALAFLAYQTEWVCTTDQSITVIADNADYPLSGPVMNGRIFSVSNGVHDPLFYEAIFGIDFGCAGDAWTAVRNTNVTIHLVFGSDISYNVGTVYPS
jgi:hypothetical protein